MYKRLLQAFFFTVILFCCLITRVQAAEFFTTNYTVNYTIADSGKAHVVSTIVLTNTTEEYYAGSYTMQLGFENLENVTVSDNGGKITPNIKKVLDGTTIDITFNKRVVGKGSKLSFTVSYDTDDVARKQGSIWELNIPKIPNQNDFESFTVHVIVPPSFGKPVYSKPKQPNDSLTFTKEQLEQSAISLSFGTEQFYQFQLFYQLKNKNLTPIKTQIALPPDTNYQEIALESMDPAPENVTKDKDGNWLATYLLRPRSSTRVEVRGKAAVSLFPKPEALSDESRAEYLKEKPYWQVSDSRIQKLAKDLKTPKAIYDYVVKSLTYDFERVKKQQARLGAVATLQNPTSAVCLEFTDLFIAITRAAGIPAREVEGFAFTDNQKQRPLSLVQDILHAWPEYYDDTRQMWIMVDPTWGNSTGGVDYFDVLDFDHFAFVRKGRSSEYPIPPSGYKYIGDPDTKDVNVSFADSFPSNADSITVASRFSPTYLSGIAVHGSVVVKNTGSTSSRPLALSVESANLKPGSQLFTTDAILPFGNEEVPVSFHKTRFLTNERYPFTIRYNEKQLDTSIHITPFAFSSITIYGGLAVGLFTIIILIIAIKTRRILFSRSKQ